MTVPSAVNIKFKFPEFRGVDDGTIEFAIEEAVVACGVVTGGKTNWIDDAQETLALMYYSAHLLQVSIIRAQSGTGQVIISERTPEMSVTYATPSSVSSDIGWLRTTPYGDKFEQLMKSNFPAVLTVNSGIRM